jgi:group I intron endonuclease
MAIVYEHLRNDTNEVFYVGIGKTEKRAFDKNRRTQYWKRIVEKVGYSVNIIHKDIDYEEAKNIEILLIEKYGRKDLGIGNLVNMTDGGEGCLGVIVSEETRQKLAKLAIGRTFSEETRQKMSKERIGEKNSFFGKTHSEEAKQKIGESNKERIGEKNGFFGKKQSDEAKEKISLAHRNRKGIKGYSWHKLHKKWIAKIVSNKKTIHLGSFDTPEEAAEAYQKAKLIYHV